MMAFVPRRVSRGNQARTAVGGLLAINQGDGDAVPLHPFDKVGGRGRRHKAYREVPTVGRGIARLNNCLDISLLNVLYFFTLLRIGRSRG